MNFMLMDSVKKNIHQAISIHLSLLPANIMGIRNREVRSKVKCDITAKWRKMNG